MIHSDILTGKLIEEIRKYPKEMLDFYDVLEHGLRKHGKLNFMEVNGTKCSKRDNYASMSRHAAQLYCGNDLDDESGLHHGLHLAVRGLISYVRYKRNLVHPDDKRYLNLEEL